MIDGGRPFLDDSASSKNNAVSGSVRNTGTFALHNCATTGQLRENDVYWNNDGLTS
jgi:hypothetical protein